jgi:cytoskeletal protein RodZ
VRIATVDEHIGSYLKKRREARGLSLAELSRATKIKELSLELLEAGRLDALPAEVFVVGFIKAYARQVGADEREAVGRFRAQREKLAPIAPAELEAQEDASGPLDGRRFSVALVVFLILIVATLTLSLLLRHGPPPGAVS